MRTFKRRPFQSLGPCLLALAFLAVPATAQGVAGNWAVSVATPQGTTTINVAFTQNGSEVAGEVELAMAETTEISDGLFEDGQLSFLLHLGFEGQRITVRVEANVDGDEMIGEARIAEMAEGASFTARRVGGG